MDKQRNRFIDEKQEKTKIIDLKEANIKEDIEEDIDTLYEENEHQENESLKEKTKIIEKASSSDNSSDKKKTKDKKKSKNTDKEKQREERLKAKNDKKLEKLMKKQKKREEHSDREVLSYEDMPLEERVESRPKKPRKSHKKAIIAVLLIIVVVFAAVFIFAGTDKLSWHNIRNYVKYGILNQKSEEQFPVSVQGENVDIGNFTRMGQDVCYASDTKLQIVNNYGRFEYSAQHGFLNPVLKTSDQYALIFSLGATGFQINDYEKVLYTGEAEERIITADINNKGDYAIVTTSNGYLSKMQVFDKENEKIFGYSFADYYVTAVSVAPNGKSAVVSGLSALNGAEISSVYVLDFTKDKPVYQDEIEENIFYDVQFLDDTYACAVGNGAACGINTKTGDVKQMQYEGKHLTCYTFNRDTSTFSISLSRSGDGRKCEIYSFKNDGSLSDSFETDLIVKSISSYKGRVALLTPDMICLYSKDGTAVSEQEMTTEPRAVVLYTSNDAYVLDTNEISTIKI